MSKQKRDYILFLQDIQSSIEKIFRYTRGMNQEKFSSNDIIIDAVIRNFEVIGEAVKHIPDEVKANYPYMEWTETVGFRNVMIHNYFGLDIEAIWDTIKNNIPLLKEHIDKVLSEEQGKE